MDPALYSTRNNGDNATLVQEDRLYKIRPLIDKLAKNFRQHGGLQEHLSIDESMVPYYGKHYAKQYIRGKPTRFGFKNWALCTNEGYMVGFDIYTGKNSSLEKHFGVGGDIVLALLQQTELLQSNFPPIQMEGYGEYDADRGQFPYQISIQHASSGRHNCGGSILNSKWILTAAHYLVPSEPSDWVIQTGTSILSSGGTHHRIARFIIHEDYSINFSIDNDVAVIELEDEIEFSNLAQPIELETELSSDEICAFSTVRQGVCSADSGGPLVANGRQIGVVSWGGVICGSDVYARVSSYVDWINNAINS
ncbi:polyserase-related [Holotrichia oblita]|uniref:Polyserase-related n=1 Tax=Holotrichia oblita TaxID=644536 RepID=A0ACB9SQ60_HOLOL|nr:polyserase-related [Holotrichia oblita]